MKQHVAIAGVVDLTGESRRDNPNTVMRNLMEFKRILEGQNVVVDAYLDLKENAIQGQITRQTSYLIRGDEPAFDPRILERDGAPAGDRKVTVKSQMDKMEQEATRNGGTVISLKNYLALTGIRPPRAVQAEEPNYNFRTPTRTPAPSPLDRRKPIAPPADKPPASNDAPPIKLPQ
jgi:hypothetical protein